LKLVRSSAFSPSIIFNCDPINVCNQVRAN
jgi:hypothetical protein